MSCKKLVQGYKNQIQIIILTISIILVLSLQYYPNNQINTLINDFGSGFQNYSGAAEQTRISTRTSYTYHNYSSLVSDLNQLNTNYPNLLELFTTQDRYGLSDCKDGYKIWVARVTNETLGFNKPEVLFIGGHHGDEEISVEAPYYLIEFLVQNYASNAFIRYLVDHREIYVMPVVNPYGWEHKSRYDGNDQDINRDYPYDKSGVEFNSDGIPLSTIGAQSVTELMKQHIFILSLSWHSGVPPLIYYAWGNPKHNTPSDESPDNIAFFEVAKQMSEYASGKDKYDYKPANQFIPASGAWSDYAYAASWDSQYLSPGYETPGARSLAFGIEISAAKYPAQDPLGKSEDVLNPSGNIGYIPQNIRMALVMIDLAEPYLTWINSGTNSIPKEADTNNNITLSWFVNGSFTVTKTNLQYGTDPDPINNYNFTTENLSGGSHWAGKNFSQEFTLPGEPNDYYLVAHAIVDQQTLIQNNPEPNVPPQSFFVNQRTNSSWSVTNNGNTVRGNKDWYSSIIHIKVLQEEKNNIQITNYSKVAFCNKPFNITWEVETAGKINHTELYWGKNIDPINKSEYKTMSTGFVGTPGNGAVKYYANFTLPTKPRFYYFVAHMNLITNSTNGLKVVRDYWSQIIQVEVIPKTPYLLDVTTPRIEYIDGYQQTLTLKGITCTNLTISEEPLNNSLMATHKAIIISFNPDSKNIYTDQERTFELEWLPSENYWYLPTMNVSSWDEGWYLVSCRFEHRYGTGQSNNKVNLELNNWFKLDHIIVVCQPTIQLPTPETEFLNLTNVTAWCSKQQLGYLDYSEVSSNNFQLHNLSTGGLVLTAQLNWSPANQSWYALNANLSNLSAGDYFIICTFSIPGLGTGESVHITGDKTEFTIKSASRESGPKNDKDVDSDLDNYYIILLVVIIFFLIFLIFLIMILRIRKKY